LSRTGSNDDNGRIKQIGRRFARDLDARHHDLAGVAMFR
jgi:hypothetical protein